MKSMQAAVTQKEVPFPPGRYLVSKTDLHGRITYANDVFADISGYTLDELIGQGHNIIRHPDMPKQAFADLWAVIKTGLPWRGVVKNRCKNGDHYWVDAQVLPIKKDGKITGYLSVRTPPSRQQIAEAEALYATLRQNPSKTVETGKTNPLARLSLRARLWLTMGAMAAITILTAVINLSGLGQTHGELKVIQEHHLLPSNKISRALFLLADQRAQVMLGLQHDPQNPNSKLHDHPLERHFEISQKNRAEINALLEEVKALDLSAHERELLDKVLEARERLSREGNAAARDALKAGNFVKANELLLTKINPIYAETAKDAEALIQNLAEGAGTKYDSAAANYVRIRNLSIAGTLATLLIAALGGSLLVAAIIGPLRRAMGHFERIAEGRLTDDIDISGRNEAGLLLCDLATMQGTLKTMLDEINAASRNITLRVRQAEAQMRQVAEQSEQQQSSVESVAAATEQFSQSVQEVAANAVETAKAAKLSQALVQDSNQHIGQSMSATTRVVDAVQASNATMDQLSHAIQKIGDVTRVIAEIANQTNLLALNAAIEAARAGEQGRGFAVVADEVRKLAERTSLSTADIAATVGEIQAVTQQAVSGMETAAREVETGIGKLRESVAGLEGITGSSREVTTMAENISDAARQQGVASEEVAVSMQRITDLIEQNTESARTAEKAVNDLLATAGELDALIGSFELHRKR